MKSTSRREAPERKSFRENLREGTCRIAFAYFFPSMLFFTYLAWHLLWNFNMDCRMIESYSPAKIDEIIAKYSMSGTGLAALLSVASFSLRTRAIELFVRCIPHTSSVGGTLNNAEETSSGLTNMALISFFTTLVLLFLPRESASWGMISIFFAALGVCLLLYCCIDYVYILFAFEKQEMLMLELQKKDLRLKNREEALKMINKNE